MEEINPQTSDNPTQQNENKTQQDVLPEARLADLPEKMRQAVALAGWEELLPVQAKAIPYIFSHRDMKIQSHTGSGKTGAYLLPMLEMINPLLNSAQVLVMVPTRELALQVANEAELFGRGIGVRSIAVYGGVGYRAQLDAFKEGAHIIIGTPGRLLDHLLRRSLSLNDLKFLILDEADHMLSMGFYPDMRRVKSYLPDHPISTYMFSATFPPQVMRVAGEFLREPGFINLSSEHIHVTETEHVYYKVPGMDKDRSLVRILEVENPLSAIIFCNTKVHVEYVTTVLKRFGYDADLLTSDLSQTAREKVLARVRSSKLRFLVATDVAARGIDLPELSHVIQYEPPEDAEAYIHRSGRTGRAGSSGTAITLVNVTEQAELRQIGKRFSLKIEERDLPDDERVEKVVSERIITLLEAKLRSRDKLQTERMQRFLPLARSLGENDEETSLLAMLLDDFYQETFYTDVIPSSSEDQQERQRTSRRPKPRSGNESERKSSYSSNKSSNRRRRPR